MYYKNCAKSIGFYDENIKTWEDWDFRIRMSKKFQYGYCSDVNSAYRKLESGLHNSEPLVHYREQIKIYNKNKHLMSDLEKSEKQVIESRVYGRLKRLFIIIWKSNFRKKLYFKMIRDWFHFIWTFQSKKAISFVYKELFFSPRNRCL